MRVRHQKETKCYIDVLFRHSIIIAFCPVHGLDHCHIFWADPQRYGAPYGPRIELSEGMVISHAFAILEVELIVPKIMRLLLLRGDKPTG